MPVFHVQTAWRMVLATAIVISAGSAQHDHKQTSALPKNFNETMPLLTKALGTFKHPISSTNPEAQAYFNQGFQLMYAFDKDGAIRSFREAEKRDPECAICYWGEAWSWGSYLNGPMQSSEAPHAYEAVQKAMQLAPSHSSPVEHAMIDALSVRYVRNFDPNKRRDQDTLYAEAMRIVHERFPQDLDAGTLYGEALFLLEPRRGSRDIKSPRVQRILHVFEDVLAIDGQHVGACHLYIHITEGTSEPGRAEACADSIGNAIPGASHLNHMPSHTWNQVGRWGDSVRANIQAWHSDQKAATGEGIAIYPPHDLHMLVFAASMDGQGAIAIQAAKDYAKITESNMYQVLSLIRFGRFDEVLEIKKRPNDPIEAGAWDFGQGYAKLRGGDKNAADRYLKRLLETAATSKAVFRFHDAQDLLGTLGGILEGEKNRADGDTEKALLSFKRAVAFQDAMIYDEPEPLPFAARHWLGAELLETKKYADAEQVYRQDLKRHPHNGWSLFGLKTALAAEGNPSDEAAREFDSSWARSDTWIRGSKF